MGSWNQLWGTAAFTRGCWPKHKQRKREGKQPCPCWQSKLKPVCGIQSAFGSATQDVWSERLLVHGHPSRITVTAIRLLSRGGGKQPPPRCSKSAAASNADQSRGLGEACCCERWVCPVCTLTGNAGSCLWGHFLQQKDTQECWLDLWSFCCSQPRMDYWRVCELRFENWKWDTIICWSGTKWGWKCWWSVKWSFGSNQNQQQKKKTRLPPSNGTAPLWLGETVQTLSTKIRIWLKSDSSRIRSALMWATSNESTADTQMKTENRSAQCPPSDCQTGTSRLPPLSTLVFRLLCVKSKSK